jgi:hypothetical protein
VNVLKSIEKRMEKTVEGLFGKAFKSSVQPVELAHKLAKEMGDHKTVSVSRVYVPNEFEVYLSPPDFEQLHSFEAALVEELGSYLVAYARREGWTLVTDPVIRLLSDADLSLGEFGIATHTAAAGPDAQASAAAAAAPLAGAAPANLSQTVVFAPPGAAAAGALAGDAAPGAPRTCGVLMLGDQAHELLDEVAVLGRSKQCDIVVADPNVSRRHAEVRREGDDYVVTDLDSTNGISVNGRQVKRVALAEGDRLELGTITMRFERRPC